jgi:hypothetical protein
VHHISQSIRGGSDETLSSQVPRVELPLLAKPVPKLLPKLGGSAGQLEMNEGRESLASSNP